MRSRMFLRIGIIVVLATGLAFINMRTSTFFDEEKKMILLRQVGHELLLSAGDSSSRVLPIIDRNKLLKEGWEDEGVITGRSLDMYVSKLRGKLQKDPDISITNIHGKGYRLSNMSGCHP
ncbi:Transcriptional regulatory protein, C terminal [Chitinophaga sp. CF118]|uniref:winged helix-turn-helix domain-containing protein n=1 Tax=Chitinophaga sp. CF118 TaxID=1884367 RepID=UPI0008EB0EFC|nr:winged helix-turn-helix domain-containing protein [Chitinophaga sp. CF118]SFF08006.1 Transcriptional regulatory protein, C terminal [Chitinophaga sp. CF118]